LNNFGTVFTLIIIISLLDALTAWRCDRENTMYLAFQGIYECKKVEK